jgi:uncharacterized protein (TIGR03086 family)
MFTRNTSPACGATVYAQDRRYCRGDHLSGLATTSGVSGAGRVAGGEQRRVTQSSIGCGSRAILRRMDGLTALDLSSALLRERLGELDSNHLGLPSVCAGWTVRNVANHVIGGAHRYCLLMCHASVEELEPTRAHDYVAEGAVTALDRHQSELGRLFRRPGAFETTVHHPLFDATGEELLGMRVIEQTLHAWDIARSVGSDEAIDPGLCEHILMWWTGSIDRLRTFGVYAAATNPTGDSAQARLLALAGR